MIEFKDFVDYVYKFAAIYTIWLVANQSKKLTEQTSLLKDQVELAKKDYNFKNDKAEIELAKYYEEFFRNKMGYIQNIFNKIEIEKLIKDIKYNQLIEFDVAELNDILSKDNILTINKKIRNINLKILVETSILLKEIPLEEYLNDLKVYNIEANLKQNAIALTDENTKKNIVANPVIVLREEFDNWAVL